MTAELIPFPRRHAADPDTDDGAAAIAARFAPPSRAAVSPYLDKPLRDEATARAQLHPLFESILGRWRP